MAAPERLAALLAQDQVTGIDFVYVYENQTTLDVFFLRDPVTLAVPLNDSVNGLAQSVIRIYSPSGGEHLSAVPIKPPMVWAKVENRDVLRIETAMPGDFSLYRLNIDDPRIDHFYNDVLFSFKANCPSDLDCKPPPHECAVDPPVDFPVDYTARDFWSFRQALLDFASQRYPQWQDRLEADVGNMLVEVMSALGDEFAYNQDRIAREAYLETATERRSLRRHAALVDYHVHDGLGASTWLDFTIIPGKFGNIPAGAQVWEPGNWSKAEPVEKRLAGSRIVYEVGRRLTDQFAEKPKPGELFDGRPKLFGVNSALNRLSPHIWNIEDVCLPVGSTMLYIDDHHQSDLLFDDFPNSGLPGKWVLLKTNPVDADVLARNWMVRLIEITDTKDLVFNRAITKLVWEEAQATPFEIDLTVLEVHGNMVPATAGRTQVRRFTIRPSDDPTKPAADTVEDADHPFAIERTGPDGSIAYLFSLLDSDNQGLVFLGSAPDRAAPEIRLYEASQSANGWKEIAGRQWSWRRELLGTNSAKPSSQDFRLDDGFWRRLVGFQRIGKEVVHKDYASGLGKTIRFGDGEFGQIPVRDTIFQAVYRLGNGDVGNVTAGTLTDFGLMALSFIDIDPKAPSIIDKVTNPLPAIDGVDPETPEQVRQLAPEAFRAITYRAVRPEDYAEAVERLPWVQRAGAAFRWTGSWLTAFATPDLKGAFTVTPEQRDEAASQLERFRQAGRPAYLLEPRYANLDLDIVVCVATSAYQGEVEERVLKALFGVKGLRPRPGFFSPDNFTFGTPLERSQLEAAIQDLEGVRAVEGIFIRRCGWFDWRRFSELSYRVAPDEVVRVENNALLPERGSVKLDLRGGA